MKNLAIMLGGVAIVSAAMPNAEAICLYRGALDANTTVAEEFSDSGTVIRGIVRSRTWVASHGADGGYGLAYRIETERRYKGSAQRFLTYYTRLGSGSLQLDVGVEYLLFLDPIAETEWMQDLPRAYVVNYNCGHSAEWSRISRPTEDWLNKATSSGR